MLARVTTAFLRVNSPLSARVRAAFLSVHNRLFAMVSAAFLRVINRLHARVTAAFLRVDNRVSARVTVAQQMLHNNLNSLFTTCLSPARRAPARRGPARAPGTLGNPNQTLFETLMGGRQALIVPSNTFFELPILNIGGRGVGARFVGFPGFLGGGGGKLNKARPFLRGTFKIPARPTSVCC